ncbi:MAG: DUF4097 family beta strand repeat-containing protein [Firmicutes bacterium]|nr:DUF4097 family beta strand repeat-containing protein [Bacillota bacterium]
MEEERLAVLRMLQEGKITVEEAAALLEALAEGSSPSKDAPVEPGPAGGPGNKVEEKLRQVKGLARTGVIEENVLSAVENVLRTVSERIDETFDSAWEGGPGIFALWPHKRVERTFTGNFSAAGEVSINLEIKNGRISLVPWDHEGFQVRAVGFVRGHQSHQAEAEFERLIGYTAGPGSLKIEATNMRAIVALSLEISLPRRLTYRISAETTNGSITTGEFTCSEIFLESTNGTVRAERTSGEKLGIETTNGSISATTISSDVSCKTVNGTVNVKVPAAISGKYRLETTNGGIRVNLPRDADLGVSLETETHFGPIRIEYPDMNITKEYRNIGNHEMKAVSRGYETASRKLDLDLETAHGSIVVS